MKSLRALKEEIDALLPREQQELLDHITAGLTTSRSSKASDRFSLEGAWVGEEESEAQYLVPERHYRSSNLGPEDQKKPDDDLL
ncbi:MAG TPA: hypothetical protein VIY68_03315 [Steroidobacteraceae bacterium]